MKLNRLIGLKHAIRWEFFSLSWSAKAGNGFLYNRNVNCLSVSEKKKKHVNSVKIFSLMLLNLNIQ